MLRVILISALLALAAGASVADEFKVVDVPSLSQANTPGPLTIAFAELRDDDPASPAGLVSFEAWAEKQPAQKRFLSPFPDYTEPMANITVDGVTRLAQEKLRMYVAAARFDVARPPSTIDLARYANLNFLEQLDPAIEHRPLAPAEADNESNKRPGRQWCEGVTEATCVQSKYRLEGKLPMAVQLVNQLTEDHKLFDYLEFQSELRILEASSLDQDGLKELTRIDTPVTGAIEQTIFHVNQLMQFGKFLAVFQADPADPEETTVTAFVALALKARLLDKAKKYEKVPVLRNLVPGMVLTGQSSFNSGDSISAGLPVFARNNLKAVAAILDGARPSCPRCFPAAACEPSGQALRLKDAAPSPASLQRKQLRLEPDLLQACRPSIDPFAADGMAHRSEKQAMFLNAGAASCKVAAATVGAASSGLSPALGACP